MPILTDNKFSAEDFQSFEVINSWWNSDEKNIFNNKSFKDSEGYTPLGAAILNGASNEYLAYVMALYSYNYDSDDAARIKYTVANNNPWRDITGDKSKGKSPLEIACMCMNVNAVEVLLHSYYEYLDTDDEGNYIPKLDNYGNPLAEDYESIPEGEEDCRYFLYTSVPFPDRYTGYDNKTYKLDFCKSYLYDKYSKPTHASYKCLSRADIKKEDILAASILKKSDILNILLHYYIDKSDKYESCTHELYEKVCNGKKDLHSSIKDNSENTPLLLAVTADCYASVYLLLDHEIDPLTSIKSKNSDGYNSLDIAEQLDDQELADILRSYFISYTISKNVLNEGDYCDIDIVLEKQPSAAVTIALSISDSSRLDFIYPSDKQLTFKSSNWNSKQKITIKATDDKIDNDDIDVIVSLKFTSADLNYADLSINLPVITIIDDR